MLFLIAHNVSGLYEGGEIKHKTMKRERMLIQTQSNIRCTKLPLLYSPCYMSVIILFFCAWAELKH